MTYIEEIIRANWEAWDISNLAREIEEENFERWMTLGLFKSIGVDVDNAEFFDSNGSTFNGKNWKR
jgi:hypothetical protein